MDIRYALRSLSRQPFLAAIAIGLLTLVIGLNTAIFRLADAVLLKPLPVKNPGELVTTNDEQRVFSDLIFDQLRLRIGSISSSPFAFTAGSTRVEMANAKSRTQTQAVKVPLVSRAYPSVWRVKAITSRKRTLGDDQADGLEIAVKYSCPFSRDQAVISKRVTLNGKLLVIVSLTPGELFGDAVERPSDVWKRFDRTTDRHADDTPGSSALPHKDRSITGRAIRNQSCVSLVGKKVEAEDEDQGPDNGQTPAAPPERAQERRR